MGIPPNMKAGSPVGIRRKRGIVLNRNTGRSGSKGIKGGFFRGKQRGGVPLSSVGRKIMPAELVSEKLEKQERKKAEAAAAVSKKVSAEGSQPRHANVQKSPQQKAAPKERAVRAKTPVRIIPLGGLGSART